MNTQPSFFRQQISAVCLTLLTALCCSSMAQDIEDLGSNRIMLRQVLTLGELGKGVLSLSWSADGKKLLVDKQSGQYSSIQLLDLERNTAQELSNQPAFQRQNGNAHCSSPAWNDTEKKIVFCAQPFRSKETTRARAGYGLHNNLWLLDDRGNFNQLTNSGLSQSNPRGVVYPTFSRDGRKIFWTQISGNSRQSSVLGMREMCLGELNFRYGRWQLDNIERYTPGEGQDFYETYGFSPDGKSVLFAAAMEDRQPWFTMNIYTMNIPANNPPQAITDTRGIWNRYAAFSPKGEKVTWSSSEGMMLTNLGPGGRLWEKYLRSELWLANKDGSDKRRLTGFNFRNAKEFDGRRAVVGMHAWNPNGRQIALVLMLEQRNYELDSSVVILELADSFVAPPAPPVAPTTNTTPDAQDAEVKPAEETVDAAEADVQDEEVEMDTAVNPGEETFATPAN